MSTLDHHTNSKDRISLAGIDASQPNVRLTTNPKAVPKPDSSEARSHKVCTDHMATVRWTSTYGCEKPKIVPHGPLSIQPTASALQYALECFEGMKVYRGYDGKLRLFRSEYNTKRLLASAHRISLPQFDPGEVRKLISKLCAIDCPKWLPPTRTGSFLYIRPTIIALDSSLGFKEPEEALLYIVISFWPLVDPSSGLRLLASSDDEVRAWPGGTGYAKIGGNYAASLNAQKKAKSQGFDQVLWLFGPDRKVTEAGSANFFVIWRCRNGQLRMVTPPLEDQIILAGVTRQSVLELSRERFTKTWASGTCESVAKAEPLEVIEEVLTMSELVLAAEERRIVSAFATGTAFFILPISKINFEGKAVEIPVDASSHISLLQHWMCDIVYGREPNRWAEQINE